MDNDAKSQSIGLAKQIITQTGINPFIVELPGGIDDPNDFALKGHSQFEFEQLLTQSKTILDIKIENAHSQKGNSGENEALKEVIGCLVNIPEADLPIYRDKISDELKIKRALFDNLLEVMKEQNKANSLYVTEGEIFDDSTISLHPALDFHENIGIVSVTLIVKINNMIVNKPFIITNEKQKISSDQNTIMVANNQRIILKNKPEIVAGEIRWQNTDIDSFIAGNYPNPAIMYQQIKDIFNRYVDFSIPQHADVLTLWTIGTYLFPVFQAYPYLHLFGTKVLTLALYDRIQFGVSDRVGSSKR